MSQPTRIRHHPRARGIKLRVLRDESVEVVAPPGTAPGAVARALARAEGWIARQRAAVRAARLPPDERGPFPRRLRMAAIGQDVAVRYADADVSRPAWRWGGAGLDVDLPGRAPEVARTVLVDALRERCRADLEPRLQRLAQRHRLEPAAVTWRNQNSRWGSCSARGRLSLNVRLLFLASELADYVLAHELAHLAHPDHSPAFWRRVDEMVSGLPGLRVRMRSAADRVPDWLLRP